MTAGSAAASPHTATCRPRTRAARTTTIDQPQHCRLQRRRQVREFGIGPVDGQHVLHEVVGPDREEVRGLRERIGHDRGRWHLDHHAELDRCGARRALRGQPRAGPPPAAPSPDRPPRASRPSAASPGARDRPRPRGARRTDRPAAPGAAAQAARPRTPSAGFGLGAGRLPLGGLVPADIERPEHDGPIAHDLEDARVGRPLLADRSAGSSVPGTAARFGRARSPRRRPGPPPPPRAPRPRSPRSRRRWRRRPDDPDASPAGDAPSRPHGVRSSMQRRARRARSTTPARPSRRPPRRPPSARDRTSSTPRRARAPAGSRAPARRSPHARSAHRRPARSRPRAPAGAWRRRTGRGPPPRAPPAPIRMPQVRPLGSPRRIAATRRPTSRTSAARSRK